MPRPTPHHRRQRLVVLLVGLALLASLVAACGSSGGGGSSDEGAATSTGETGAGSDAASTGRIVALGEERVLADLLALGIRPVASTANATVDGEFVGLDGLDAEGIEPLPSDDPNIERLAALEPDVIVVNEFVEEYLGRDVLDQIGEVVVVPDGDAVDQVEFLGEAFDREDEAEQLVADFEAAVAEGRETAADLPAGDREVSVATVYSGNTVAAWVAGPVDVPATLLDLGYTLVPDAAAVPGTPGGETDGRAYLSEEQVGLLDAPTLVLMQSDAVEGDAEALAERERDAIWQGLPAVADGRVIVMDRLGYPGIAGRIRLVDDLVEQLET